MKEYKQWKVGCKVIAKEGFKISGIETKITDVRRSRSTMSGISIQTGLRKGYYDSGWFDIFEDRPDFLKTKSELIAELKLSEIF